MVLFDEWEKADPSVGNALLSVFDEGAITDARGVSINFKNTIIVMTSNLGARYLTDLPPDVPAEAARPQIMAEVRKFMAPELLNRIDDVILFRRLPEDLMVPIVRKEIRQIEASLQDTHPEMQLRVSDRAIEWLGKTSYDPAYGARPVRRTVHRELLSPLAELLIEQEAPGNVIEADRIGDDSKLTIKFV